MCTPTSDMAYRTLDETAFCAQADLSGSVAANKAACEAMGDGKTRQALSPLPVTYSY